MQKGAAFQQAVKDKDVKAAQKFLAEGVDPDIGRSIGSESAMKIAAAQGDVPMLKTLLKAHAALDGENPCYQLNALH